MCVSRGANSENPSSYPLRRLIAGKSLDQNAPVRHPDLELEDLEKKLAKTPESTPMLRKFLETRIAQLKSEIRNNSGIESPKAEAKFDPAKQVKLPETSQDKPKRWEPPNRPLTIEDLKIRRAIKAEEEAAKAMARTPSETPAWLESTDSRSQFGNAFTLRPVDRKKIAVSYSPAPDDARFSKWDFRFSYVAVAILYLLWAPPNLRFFSAVWANSGSLLDRVFTLIFLAVILGALFGAGPFFVIRAHLRRPKRLETAHTRSDWDNICKKHARRACRTCLRWQWNLHRTGTWSGAAVIYYLILGMFVLVILQSSGYGLVADVALGLNWASGLLLWVSAISPEIFRLRSEPPLEMSWGVLKCSFRSIRGVLQLILSSSLLILLSGSLWSDNMGPLRIAITSITLYFIAIFWSMKHGALERSMWVTVQGLGQRAARYRAQAMSGGAQAQFDFGLLYEMGDGVQIDEWEAFSWFSRAAEQGHPEAQVKIGNMYYHGSPVPCEYAQAEAWFRKAAQQGNAVALKSLGLIYAFGPDMLKAAAWRDDAFFRGDMIAEQGFSGLYQAAKREPKDYKEGYFWLYLAATKDRSAEKDRDQIAAKLSAAETTEIQDRAKKWLAEHRRC